MLVFGCTTLGQSMTTVLSGIDVLLFLLALMVYSALLDRSGFFDWSAAWSVRLAGGNTRTLYRNVFLVGAVITALLSLDTTAVVLTPAVVAFVSKLRLKELPFLLACAFIANTGSLLLPVSNLTNLIFQSQFHLGFGRFVQVMFFPQAIALGLNYVIFRILFRRDLALDFDARLVPSPSEEIRDRPFFLAALGSLGFVLIGYFVGSIAGIPPYLIAFSACALLGGVGLLRKRIGGGLLHEISWPLFPFVVGLFVVVRAFENLPFLDLATQFLARHRSDVTGSVIATSLASGLGSNLVNNIPAALVSEAALHASAGNSPSLYAALIGCNVGPNLTVFGSLATMLVISSARKRGIDVSAATFFKVGLITMPIVLVSATLALLLEAPFLFQTR